MRRLTLRVAIESALRSRFRQYELRDHLEERARQDERLRQSQKMESIGILAGGVAHDFNNLLTGVLGNASLALDYLPESSPVRRPIQDVVEASERAAHLTRQLLAYAGKGRFVVEEIDLSQQIRQIAALIHTSIPNAVQVQLNLADNLPCIEADASQLQQVVMNLIINGAEAIAEGQTGTVIVTTGVQEASEKYLRSMEFDPPMDPGRYVFMEVIDSGVGMDAEMQAHIFDPFFTTKFAGRGLGLAAVLGIIRGHAGALKIYSTPGRGTTFRVLFPVSKNRDQVTKAEAVDDAHALNGGGTVLVIDDEALVRNVAKAALERSGYAVQVCADGRAGIEAFRTTAAGVSVVLLDMSMPNMSGEETYKRLMEIKSDVKVVLSSGYSEKEAVSRFAGKGLAGFIQKPYSSARLAEVIDSVLN
jgi:signal transduction histidine kinase